MPQLIQRTSTGLQSNDGETDTSTEDGSVDNHGSAGVDYKILPSTPSLIVSEPLLSESAGQSVSSSIDTQ